MKIALCSDSFLPVIDGVGRVVYEYAKQLSLRGHECYVITPYQNSGYRGGSPFETVDFVSMALPSAQQYRTGIAMLDKHYSERIKDLDFDVIHAHTPGFSGREAVRLAEKLGRPLIGTFHSKYYDDFLRITGSDVLASLGAKYVAKFYEECSEVWTVSEYASGVLRSYGYEGGIRIVPNGSEVRSPKAEDEELARREFGLDRGTPILLYVGQIDRKKNLNNVIIAAAICRRHGCRFRLVLAGKGQDREELETLSRTVGLGDALFTGHISDVNLLDGLYMAAELFLFPSMYDTAGLVIREAAVMGTPSVVSRGSAPAECIRDGENGLVCENDAESLSKAILGYLGLSPAERKRISENARRTVPLAWESVFDEVEALYRRLSGTAPQQ